jgi:hypothetical protein
MQHTFSFAASRFAGAASRARGEEVAAWLRAQLLDASEEAEIGDPSPEGAGWTFWYSLGGDRYGINVTSGGADWIVTLEGSELPFVRRHESSARRQARFDGLVTLIRTIILSEPTASLKAESGD